MKYIIKTTSEGMTRWSFCPILSISVISLHFCPSPCGANCTCIGRGWRSSVAFLAKSAAFFRRIHKIHQDHSRSFKIHNAIETYWNIKQNKHDKQACRSCFRACHLSWPSPQPRMTAIWLGNRGLDLRNFGHGHSTWDTWIRSQWKHTWFIHINWNNPS